jgi:hypothetical protein
MSPTHPDAHENKQHVQTADDAVEQNVLDKNVVDAVQNRDQNEKRAPHVATHHPVAVAAPGVVAERLLDPAVVEPQ